jgi:hypothetical protein
METLFDLQTAEAAKLAGMDLAAVARDSILDEARRAAVFIASLRDDRSVSADDVMERLCSLGRKPEELGNAAGSVFRGKRWRWNGKWVKSRRETNHARMIRVWELIA